jgi:hypothetical protein
MRPFDPSPCAFVFDAPGLFSFCSTPADSFRMVALSISLLRFLSFAFNLLGCCSYPTHLAFSGSFPCASLRLAVVELPSHSVSSQSFFLGFDLFHLRRRIVSFRLACLRLHSTSTFLHISGRPVLRPRGGGVGHRRQNKHQKHQTKTKKKTKKKTATITMPRKPSRLIHGRNVQS